MGTPIRSPSEISQLYGQLADQISAKNTEEVRRAYKELLRSGEPVGAIVGIAMSSVNKVENHRKSRGPGSAMNKPSGVQQISVGLRQSATEVSLQRALSVNFIDRSERSPVALKQLRRADGDGRPLNALRALLRAQTEPTQVSTEAETPEPAAVDRVGDSDDPRLPSPPRVAQCPRPGSGLQSIARLATRTIIVLTAALVATVGSILLPGGHRPADEYRAAALQPAVVSPPTLATAVVAAGLSRAAPSVTVQVPSAALSVDTRSTVSLPSAVPTPAIAATPAIVLAEARGSFSDATALLRLGDALLASGNVTSASVDTRPKISIPSAAPTEALLSSSAVTALLWREDAMLATGNVTSARPFYKKAAIAGAAVAALRLGGSYDSLFLARAGLSGVRSDHAEGGALAPTRY
jgi:hypothetical protein